MSTSLLDAALDLAARGFHVFPLKPDDKRPALYQDWESRATVDPDRITRCWSTGPFNIGVACGPSGLLVVDLDTPKPNTGPAEPPFDAVDVRDGFDALALLAEQHAEPLPVDTLQVRTGRGGAHLYFRQPDGPQLRNTAGKLGWLIDTRGSGGYVVAPGSIVAGNPYAIVHDDDPAALPRWIQRLADPPPAPRRMTPLALTGAPSKYADAVLTGEVQRVLSAPAGTRNHTLNAVAFTLGTHIARGTMPQSVAEHALTQVAERFGTDLNKSLATIRSGLEAGQRKGHPR